MMIDGEWLSLQEASTLLTVSPSTLRRWADAGSLPVKRTVGGHRRFPRAAVAQLAGAESMGSPSSPPPSAASALRPAAFVAPHAGWHVDEQELARQDWHVRLASRPAALRMRGLGQQLLGMLIQHINSHALETRFLNEARSVAAHYGEEARAAIISMHDMVEAFLFFRRCFSQTSLPVPGILQPTDRNEAADLQGRIDHFMDAVLLGAIAGYEGAAV